MVFGGRPVAVGDGLGCKVRGASVLGGSAGAAYIENAPTLARWPMRRDATRRDGRYLRRWPVPRGGEFGWTAPRLVAEGKSAVASEAKRPR